MEEQDVLAHAQAMCAALVAGDIDAATADVSQELRRNLGEVISLFPLPATEATIESVERGASSFTVVLRIVGETEEAQVQTRWKGRDEGPTIIEASHLSRVERVGGGEDGTADESDEDAEA